jgi:Domain of unknown function (DUF5666)
MSMSFHPYSRIRCLWRAVLASLMSLALLHGCGGGVDTGGTGSYSSGPITGFGSVIVNGVRYDDTSASVQDDDGVPRASSELRLGMIVDIDASPVTSGADGPVASAQTIRINSEIVGAVDSVDAAGGSLVVVGQSVRVNASTVFDESFAGGLAGVTVGQVVEVHAQFDIATLSYTATRVDPKSAAQFYKLRGIVNQLDTTAKTFRIAGQTINYAAVAPANLPLVFVNGRFVRVLVRPTQVAGQWIAVAVRAGVRPIEERREARLEGRITALTSSGQFSVNGIEIDASGAQFPDGTAGIVLGARVQVEGAVQGGAVVARKVELQTDDRLRDRGFDLIGVVSAVNTTTKTLVLRGVTVHYAFTLRYDNGSEADLAPGRLVFLRGVLSADRTRLVSTRITFLN